MSDNNGMSQEEIDKMLKGMSGDNDEKKTEEEKSANSSNGQLSQDEIDAMLKGDSEEVKRDESSEKGSNGGQLSQDEIDAMLKGGSTDDVMEEESGGGQLSQDEIDAMLKQQSASDDNEATLKKSQVEMLKEEKEKIDKYKLSQDEKDMLGELANISFGSASTTLSSLLGQQVNITTPIVDVVDSSEIDEGEVPHVVLNVDYVTGLEMKNMLIIKKEVALAIADLMLGGSGKIDKEKEVGEMELSAVQEAMNQMMGSSATAMADVFGRAVDISPPNIKLVELKSEIEKLPEENVDKVVRVTFDLDIGGFIQSKLIQAISVKTAKTVIQEMKKMTGVEENEEPTNNVQTGTNELLTQEEKDAIGELANISFGSASTALSNILTQSVNITTPFVQTINKNKISGGSNPQVVLNVDFIKGLEMQNILVIEKDVALAIADLMLGGNGKDIDPDKQVGDMELSAVQEAMNQMMGSSATAMSEVFGKLVDITPPKIKLIEEKEEMEGIFGDIDADEEVAFIVFDLDIGGFISSKLVQAMSIETAKKISKELMEVMGGVEEGKKEEKKIPRTKELESKSLGLLLEGVDVKIEVVFGKTKRKLKDLLTMDSDKVVTLQEEIDEPLRVYANGVLIAEGEMVTVDDHFGVKIKKMI